MIPIINYEIALSEKKGIISFFGYALNKKIKKNTYTEISSIFLDRTSKQTHFCYTNSRKVKEQSNFLI